MHFVYEGAHWSAASVPDWRQNVVVIGTFSKSFGMMGWRVGYMLADASVCEQAVKVQDAMIICAPVISQMAAEAAVRESWSLPGSFHDELRAAQTRPGGGAGTHSGRAMDADARRPLRVRADRRLRRLHAAVERARRAGARRDDSRRRVRDERRGIPSAVVRVREFDGACRSRSAAAAFLQPLNGIGDRSSLRSSVFGLRTAGSTGRPEPPETGDRRPKTETEGSSSPVSTAARRDRPRRRAGTPTRSGACW